MKTIAGFLLLWLVFCFLCFSLTGCSRKTPVENAFHEVETSIVAVKENLPPECQTKEVLAKIDEVEWKRQTAESVCQATAGGWGYRTDTSSCGALRHPAVSRRGGEHSLLERTRWWRIA